VPAFNVVSSIDINVPAAKVREALADFNTWPIWSPWLIMEGHARRAWTRLRLGWQKSGVRWYDINLFGC